MIILSVPQPLVFISLGNSEQPRENEEHSKPFLFFFFWFVSGRQEGALRAVRVPLFFLFFLRDCLG